ncbi:MAG: SRPBCC family protein [Solirubrobacterales bacterium]
MDPTTVSNSVDAPPERVYEAVCDLGLRPLFADHFQKDFRLARIESSGSGAAARFQVSPPGLGRLWVETVIAEAERPSRVVEHGRCGRLGRITLVTTWEMLERDGGTDVQLTFLSRTGNPFDRAREVLGARRWYRRKWRKALRRLAALVEGDLPAERRVDLAGGDRASTGVF